jgi:cell division protein FtsB
VPSAWESVYYRTMRSSREVRRRRDPSFWKAINRVLMVFVFAGAIAIVIFWFYPQVIRRDEMVKNLEAEKQKLTAMQLLQKQRERQVYLLENDPTYVETVARDKLDMMKEGETIYRFDAPKGATPERKN